MRRADRALMRLGIAVAAMSLSLSAAGTPAGVEDTFLADLSGSAWQLVEIQSMDDSVARPAKGRAHTLTFGVDGSVSVVADCNRATGALAVFNPPSMAFSEFAATGALCGPDSLGERFLRELGWVRSYVYQGDRLHLATMADGSILVLDPLASTDVTAQVLGLSLVIEDADALRGIVLARLLDDYARREDIRASASAVEASLAAMDRQMREELGDDYEAAEDLSADEQTALAGIRRSMAASVIRSREINRRLYEDYGGRVIYQQLGPEPLDAYAAFLRDAARAGRFRIDDAALEQAFWGFFEDAERHDFYPDSEAAGAFIQPPLESRGQ